MTANLLPNAALAFSKFSAWTVAKTGSATAPVGTYSATSGPDSTPGLTISSTGTSGGVELTYQLSLANADSGVLVVSAVIKGSSASANATPITVTFQDGVTPTPNTVVAYVPYADATYADTNAHLYVAVAPVPLGAVQAQIVIGYTHWAATGGYSAVVSSPACYLL
jgi:hypothetical protein